MLRTNRGLLNEWLYGRWRLLIAFFYATCIDDGTVTIDVWTETDTDRIAKIEVRGKLFYEYGKE